MEFHKHYSVTNEPPASLTQEPSQRQALLGYGPGTGISNNKTRTSGAAGRRGTPGGAKSLWVIWAFEMACILLSALLFTVVIFVLFSLNQKPLPEWPLGVTLNSFLAFFTTLSKAAFMVPVSVAISQTQWTWFDRMNSKPKPLYDFDVIDQASRGAWGSLVLLWRFRLRHFVVLGALLFAISTLTSPITQLAINYPLRDIAIVGEEAKVQAVQDLSSPRDSVGIAAHVSTHFGSFLDSTKFEEPISYSTIGTRGAFCSTGNCTFERFHSIGVCMKMANISSFLRVNEFRSPTSLGINGTTGRGINGTRFIGWTPIRNRKVWKASLPGGYQMVHQSTATMFTEVLSGNHTFGFKDDPILQQSRIVSFVLIHTTPTVYDKAWWESAVPYNMTVRDMADHIEDFRHDAVEILFHLCVHTYETKVELGKETTRIVDSFTEPLAPRTGPYLELDCGPPPHEPSHPCRRDKSLDNTTLSLKAPRGDHQPQKSDAKIGNTFTADYRAMDEIATGLRTYMGGSATILMALNDEQDYPYVTSGTDFMTSLFEWILFSKNTIKDPVLRQTSVRNIYQNVATCLSATLRGSQIGGLRLTRAVFNVTGEATRMVPHVEVTWPWLSVLAAEIALAALFLALTIANQAGSRSSKFRDVKSSSLATLVALNDECRAVAGQGLGSVSDLEKVAKELPVRIEGGQIVLAKDAKDAHLSD